MAKKRVGDAVEPDIVILGASGQVGSELVRQLPPEQIIPRAREMASLTDYRQVRDLIVSVKPRIVINAAVTSPFKNYDHPYEHWMVNSFGVDHLVKTCALNGAAFIHLSTSDVFGIPLDHGPRVELDPVSPLGGFAASKAAGEQAVLAVGQYPCADFVDFRYWIIRSSMLYARPTRFHHNLLQIKLEQAIRSRGPVQIPRDVIRSATYVPDLVAQLVWLINNHREVPSGIYHVANRGSQSLYDLVNRARFQVDNRPMQELAACTREQFLADGSMTREPLSENGSLNCQVWDEISPLPMRSWEDALSDFCEEYKTHQMH